MKSGECHQRLLGNSQFNATTPGAKLLLLSKGIKTVCRAIDTLTLRNIPPGSQSYPLDLKLAKFTDVKQKA